MQLDNEDQRTTLVQLITNIPLQGNLQAMAQNVQALGALLEAVKNAKIGEAAGVTGGITGE